jgi:MraZ protein
MFRGLYEHSMDPKGRTSFPARFRESLASATKDDSRIVLTSGIDPCLVVYPIAEWEAFEAKLAKLSQFDRAVQRLKRIYVAAATEVTLDKHGRLLIPPTLRAYADLEAEVLWAGMVSTVEVWSKANWQAQVDSARAVRSEIGRELTELGL